MYKLRRKLFSQNFLVSRKLITKLLGRSSLGQNDLVLEIGPGKGIITEQLVQFVHHVVAVEIDTQLYHYLQNKFTHVDTITLYNADFLRYRFPEVPYKVFANIPFSQEGVIVRKLIDADNPPEDCYLVVMRELAYRLTASYRENMFSLMHKPWFDFSIPYHFRRTEFTPVPAVDAVLFRFVKKEVPLLPFTEKKKFQLFIRHGFGHGLSVYRNLQVFFSKKKTLQALSSQSLRKDVKPSQLSLEEWVELYKRLCL